MITVCEEMKKFMKLLDERGIPYHDNSEAFDEERFICRVHADDNSFSCINGFGTHGGFLYNPKENPGLLELWIEHQEPMGYLTAEDAIQGIENSHNV
jgi:hypothetical protein